jgi:dGTPase
MIDLADEIAYLTADLDDGLESGILTLEQVREGVPLFRNFHDAVLREYPAAAPKLTANEALDRVLNLLVTDLLQEVRTGVAALGAATLADIRNAPRRLAAFSPHVEAARAAAKQFLYAHLYNSPGMEEAHAHATQVVEGMFAALIADPTQLPRDHQAQIPNQGLARTVADYIAGMTDSYIEQTWLRLTTR